MSDLTFQGRCWTVDDHVPTDQIVKSHRVFRPLEEIAHYVLEDANPRFAIGVEPGDVLVAGLHFGQSSGRAIATKAVKATGVGCVVADSFSRTFYRNAFETGLPILEVPDVRRSVEEGDELTVDVAGGTVRNARTGRTLCGHATDRFLLEMLRGGGLIPTAPNLVEGNL